MLSNINSLHQRPGNFLPHKLASQSNINSMMSQNISLSARQQQAFNQQQQAPAPCQIGHPRPPMTEFVPHNSANNAAAFMPDRTRPPFTGPNQMPRSGSNCTQRPMHPSQTVFPSPNTFNNHGLSSNNANSDIDFPANGFYNPMNNGVSTINRQRSAAHLSTDNLCPGVQNQPLVGFVLNKDDVKTFEAKEGSSGEGGARSVLSFTVRDSPFSHINVSLWSRPERAREVTGSFNIGDIVEITGCNVKDKQPSDDKYRPWTPSNYHIVLNDSMSTISQYEGSDMDEFVRLAHMPLQTPGPVYKLSEIVANVQNLDKDLISFVAAVRNVSPARSITSKATGRKMHLREVKLFDQNIHLFYLVLWSNELIQLSEHWLSNETVLAITDVKVTYDQYKKAVVASASSKSVFILNPDTREGASLYQFAQTVTWPAEDTEKSSMALQSIDLTTVRIEHNITEFVRMADDMNPDSSEHSIIYGYLSSFDIDGSIDSVLSGKCCECGRMLQSLVSGRCTNYDCLSSDILELTEGDIFYNLRVDISDHTGTLTHCKLSADVAASMLQCKADVFASLDDSQRTFRKWQYLFERCKFIVKAYRVGDASVSFVILESSKVTCQDHIKHLR